MSTLDNCFKLRSAWIIIMFVAYNIVIWNFRIIYRDFIQEEAHTSLYPDRMKTAFDYILWNDQFLKMINPHNKISIILFKSNFLWTRFSYFTFSYSIKPYLRLQYISKLLSDMFGRRYLNHASHDKSNAINNFRLENLILIFIINNHIMRTHDPLTILRTAWPKGITWYPMIIRYKTTL